MIEPAGVLVDAAEEAAVRSAVVHAVLTAPAGVEEQLAHDPVAYLRLVAAARIASDESSRLLRDAVDGARTAGHRWDVIGQVLGVSKQAAQQRFGQPGPSVVDAVPGPADRPERRLLAPLTAFTEMAALEEAGRHGWHSVEYGTLRHVVEESPWEWEHQRQFAATGGRHQRLIEQGWQLIGTMRFPWAYYARPTDRPAQPGPWGQDRNVGLFTTPYSSPTSPA